MGKTNLDQFACGLVGTRSPYGIPQNAFDDRFVPGGSSSGSAVAVARGLATFALGTDTAGSGTRRALLDMVSDGVCLAAQLRCVVSRPGAGRVERDHRHQTHPWAIQHHRGGARVLPAGLCIGVCAECPGRPNDCSHFRGKSAAICNHYIICSCSPILCTKPTLDPCTCRVRMPVIQPGACQTPPAPVRHTPKATRFGSLCLGASSGNLKGQEGNPHSKVRSDAHCTAARSLANALP